MDKIKQVVSQFLIQSNILSIKPFGSGHINRTFLVETEKEKYVLQKVNTMAFKTPTELMDNIIKVTSTLAKKGVETMTFIPTKDGKYYYEQEDFYRMYIFVDKVIVFQEIPNAEVFKQAGFAFGEFINNLNDLDCTELNETIKDFHNTPKRFEALKVSVEKDSVGRVESCREEIDFIFERANTLSTVVEELKNGKLPLRTTHNDTKLNNILIDEKTLTPRMVIDLDTVMPGSLLYDFGDAIRTGASTASEDEKDLDKVHFNVDLFKAYTEGFYSALKESMTDREAELLPYGAYLMIIESGIRFLKDYIDGDVYFPVEYPEHNLVRTRTQLKLVKELEENFDKASAFITELREN